MAKITIEKVGRYYEIKGVSAAMADAAGRALIYSRKIGRMFSSHQTNATRVHRFFLPDVYLLCREAENLKPEDWMDLQAVAGFKKLRGLLERMPEIESIKDRLSESYTGKPIDYSRHLKSLVFKPLEHQAPFLEHYLSTRDVKNTIRGSLLNAAAGTGKTYTSLALGEILGLEGVLIVSPNAAIQSVWHAAFEAGKDCLFKTPKRFWSSKDPSKPTRGQNVFICHYEYLEKMFDRIRQDRLQFEYIIVDESHNFANIDSAQTRMMVDIVRLVNPRDTLLLSGTPIKAMSREVASVFFLLDSSYDNEAHEVFKKVHGGRNNGSAVDILRQRLGMISYIIEKKALKLAEPVYTDHHLVLSDIEDYSLGAVSEAIQKYTSERKPVLLAQSEEYRDEFYQLVDRMFRNQTGGARVSEKQYKTYKSDVAKIIATTNYRPLYEEMRVCSRFEKALIAPQPSTVDAKRLKEIKGIVKYPVMVVVGEALGRVLTRRRIDCFKSMAQLIPFEAIIETAGKKVVIFSSYVEVCEAIYQRLAPDLEPIRVYGEHTKDLTKSVKLFGDVPDLNPLIATYASLSTAVPLIMADTEVLIDLPFREFVLNQAISRVHRIGNTTGTYIHKFTIGDGYPDNIVSRGFDIISWAKSQAEDITGVKSPLAMLDDKPGVTLESIADWDGWVDDWAGLDDLPDYFNY